MNCSGPAAPARPDRPGGSTAVARRAGRDVLYLDCDVEEPNAHLFLKPQIRETRTLNISIPDVGEKRCTACGACDEICQYSAILLMAGKVMVLN